MADPCLHEREWGKVIELVDAHDKEIYGNGKPGMRQEVAQLAEKIDNLHEDVKGLSTNVSALLKFENEWTGIERYKEKHSSQAIAKAGLYVSVAAIIITAIIKFL